ncbi:MAG: PD-(D/E)XK nuclease family protein, partial [Bacillota bacterium]|nr:PD-(D/E)XK nuclease family protein [Bacillota bacterium]
IRGQKLAETIQSQTRRPSVPLIDKLGREMLLKSIAQKNAAAFKTFGAISGDSSFLALVSEFIVQLKQNGYNSTVLDQLSSKTNSPILSDKLSDMKIFFQKYEDLMTGKFTDSEDLVLFTADNARYSPFVTESVIYYYGFYSFTSREIYLLEELAKNSKGFNIALLSGKEAQFDVTRNTIKKIQKNIPNSNIITSDDSPAPFTNLPKDRVHIISCASPFSQALTIAADIKRKVREEKLSYSDIAVLTGNSPEMSESIKRVFKEVGIPLFNDEKRTVLHSGAIEALSSSLALAVDNFKAADVIRFIKSGALDFNQDDIENFENYIKLYHIKEAKFAKPFKYGKDKLGEETFTKLEEMRQTFYDFAKKFTDNFNNATSVLDKSLVLYKYLAEDLKLPQRLESLAVSQENAGLLDASEESRQIWDALISLLDQMVDLLGTETLSTKDYTDLLISTLSDIKVGVLPQSEGKVSLGTVTRSQIEEIKALYIAGINDNIIPGKNDPTSILTPNELKGAEELGFTLSKTSDRLSEEEIFSIYKSMSAASDYLFLSYCAFDATGSELRPSTLISDIRKLYPDNEIESDIQNAQNNLAFIEGKTLTLNKLSSVLRESIEKGHLDPIWMACYNILKDSADEIKAGLRYTNKKSPLGKEIAAELFAKSGRYSLSPSRLDNFASCPFKHFVSYGLKPKEEQEFSMNAAEIGTIHHEALLRLCNQLSLPAKKSGIAITDPASLWMTVTDSQLEEMLISILTNMQSEILDGVMTSSKESEYLSKRTKATCLKFAKHMVEEVRHSVIDEMYFESRFGANGVFPAIVIETSA